MCNLTNIRWNHLLAVWIVWVCSLGQAWAQPGFSAVDRATAEAAGISPACTVALFGPTAFAATGEGHRMDSQPLTFDFHLPAVCGKRWSRVVLSLEYAVPAGRQFDRTASLWLDGVNLFMGTTEEPGTARAPRWTVSRDLSDYQALFLHAAHGRYTLNNWVDQRYTSPIQVSAHLSFYAADISSVPRSVPTQVLSMSADSQGQAYPLQNGADELVRRVRLPRNTTALFLDVIAQSQANDEQWYNCVPDRIVGQTRNYALEAPYSGMPFQECGGGAFRMVEALIDGQPAGLAPVTPWTYTGGVDPYLWRPTPDVQTLNFRPYRMDLSAFAGVLDDGHSHQLSIRVLGANHYFTILGNLLAYTDASQTPLHGGLLANTLSGQKLQAVETVAMQSRPDGDGIGHARVFGSFVYVQQGYLDTPAGRRVTRVESRVSLSNDQHFSRPAVGQFRQWIVQHGQAELRSTVRLGDRTLLSYRYRRQDPLSLNIVRTLLADHSFITDIEIKHGLDVDFSRSARQDQSFQSSLRNHLQAQTVTHWNPEGAGIVDNRGQQGSQQLSYRDSQGGCIRRQVTSHDGRLQVAVRDDNCAGSHVVTSAWGRADGSPSYP